MSQGVIGWRSGIGLSGVLAALLSGCATYSMMPTPVLYTGSQAKPLFTDRALDRTPSIDLMYVTDRAPATDSHANGPYTAGRSRYLAFGSTTVEFGDRVSWDVLAAQSTLADRTVSIDLNVGTKSVAPRSWALLERGLKRCP